MKADDISPPLPGPTLLEELAEGVEAAAEEEARKVLGSFPRGERRDSVLHAFQSTGTAAKLGSYAVINAVINAKESSHPDWENVERLWHALLNIAGPFHGHPAIPELIHETLAEWQAGRR